MLVILLEMTNGWRMVTNYYCWCYLLKIKRRRRKKKKKVTKYMDIHFVLPTGDDNIMVENISILMAV